MAEAEVVARQILRNSQRAVRSGQGDDPRRQVDLVGRHCESGDVLSAGVALREPRVGDVVAVRATGAYCFTMRDGYNGALRPQVVFVRGAGARLVVRRERYDDLLRLDV
jgi:diaminopimelate decarboxylase